MLRLKDNPPMTLPSAGPLAKVDGLWSAAYCKPRQEKALAWDLCRKEVPYFLPMILRETSSGGRRRRNLYPMFNSYVFFAGNEDQRLEVLKTQRLVTTVNINDAQQATFRQEIASLELGLRTVPEEIELYSRLVEGQWVRVIGGPMRGVEGVILEGGRPKEEDEKRKVKGTAELLLGVTMMGTGAKVAIHPDLVEPWQRDWRAEPRSTVTVAYNLEHKPTMAKCE